MSQIQSKNLIIYTDENLGKLSFEQINEEFNKMLEYLLGTSLCPKCGYVSWITGYKGTCLEQCKPESTNEIVKKYFDLNNNDKIGIEALQIDEEAMKLLLKNPEVIRDNFYWECNTCHTKFLSKVVWNIFEEESK